jgi:type II secretory pathway pseudopilin PulG
LARNGSAELKTIYLVVAVVVVALLAAVWYPGYRHVVVDRHIREARQQLTDLIRAEQVYYSENGRYVDAMPRPQQSKPQRFGTGACTPWASPDATRDGFDQLGWSPGKCSFCRFAVAAEGSSLTAAMECDLATPNHPVRYAYVQPMAGKWEGPADPFGGCSGEGIYVGSTHSGILSTVGPCDEESMRVSWQYISPKSGFSVTLDSYPSAATVQLNGKTIGSTPIDVVRPPKGPLMIRIGKTGYEPIAFTLLQKPQPYVLRVALKRDHKASDSGARSRE